MARTKKAPVVRNVINNNIPNSYRAINHMNGIVTMIEYTGEDDIKAYELEPNYRELGGGNSDFSVATLTIVNNTGNSITPICAMFYDVEGHSGTSGNYEGLAGNAELDVILYKGNAIVSIVFSIASQYIASTSGDIEALDATTFNMTGNATVTVGIH